MTEEIKQKESPSTEDLIDSQRKIFNELKITIDEQKDVNRLINLFILALFFVVTVYFFVV